MTYCILFAGMLLVLLQSGFSTGPALYHVVFVEDFEITGDGSNASWEKAEWLPLTPRTGSGESRETKAKVVYSRTGLYVLFFCEDTKLTATMEADFLDLWNEDVVEIFLWPSESEPVYFEYELSPLNYELAILVSNENGDIVRWQPFHYLEDRHTRRATAAQGGEIQPGASVDSWTAEFFIPYSLMRPLKNAPPRSGTTWRANLYPMDYDEGRSSWAWLPTNGSFHQLEKFGTFYFE